MAKKRVTKKRVAKKRVTKKKVTRKKKVSRKGSVAIDTVPLPEKPISIEIPIKLLKEFKKDLRVVVRHPWIIGIPIPERMLKLDALKNLKGLDVMLVSRAGRR